VLAQCPEVGQYSCRGEAVKTGAVLMAQNAVFMLQQFTRVCMGGQQQLAQTQQ